MGHTSTGAATGHEAVLAVGYCVTIGVVSAARGDLAVPAPDAGLSGRRDRRRWLRQSLVVQVAAPTVTVIRAPGGGPFR